MPKNLSLRIAEKIGTQTPDKKGKNRVAFLAHRDEIQQALEDGWTAKMIWATLKDEGKIGFSYQAFTRYVKRLTTRPATSATKTAATTAHDANKGFTFNPIPNKEELL